MSIKLKKLMSLMIAVFVAFSMMVIGTDEASAASAKVKVYINNQIEKTNHIYVGEQTYVTAYATKGDKYPTIKKVKVADKSVAKVKIKKNKYNGKIFREYYVVGKKPGKTKVSVRYKFKGKTKTKNLTVTVREYPNPLASLTINGKNIPLAGDTGFLYEAKCKKTKVRIKAVAAEGWEITSVDSYTVYGKSNKVKDLNFKNIKKAKNKIKNGKVITFPKKHRNMTTCIYLENEEGDSVFYEVLLNR